MIVRYQNYSQISLPSDTNVNIGRTFSGRRRFQQVSNFTYPEDNIQRQCGSGGEARVRRAVRRITLAILTDDPHATVETTFRGINAFGGVVKKTVSVRGDLRTGNVVSFNEV